MKKIVALLLMSVMMLALTGCGGSDKKDEKAAGPDKKVVLKLSHVFSPDEQLYKSMELVAERINKKTNGRVEIQCFGQNQLACYKDGLEQVANGANFISVEDPSYLGDYVPDFKPLVGPMLYQSYDEYEKMIETPLVKDMEKKAEEKAKKEEENQNTEKRKNALSQMRLRSVFKMRMSILNTATTEQMGYGIISFFVCFP